MALVERTRDEPPRHLLMVLYTRDHERIGQRMVLTEVARLGRACAGFSGIPLDDARMSRHHATVYAVEDGFVIEDAGSTNGTLVNGRETTRAALKEGDVVQVGNTFLQYLVAAPDPDLVPGSLVVGFSPSIEALRMGLTVVAPTSTTVLVVGEPGVGKRTIGREVHRLSGRSGSLVAVECGAGSPEEVEEQLFGRARSGPVVDGPQLGGALTAAAGGTVMLVDVDRLSARAQVRLAWALDEIAQHYEAGSRDLPRLVATASERLRPGEHDGFREDLYSRLVAWSVDVPPLRERPMDIGALAAATVRRFSESHGTPAMSLSPELVWALVEHPWPRNVPEVLAVVEAGCVEAAASEDRVIRPTERIREMLREGAPRPQPRSQPGPPRSRGELIRVLRDHDLVVSRVAEFYGKHRQQIYRWMDRFDVDLNELRG
ncbi:MAG: sigma 54-interacting transcriptional regulator [Myxococcota bacterium]